MAMKPITIDVTYAELTALMAVNGLFQGVNYFITDRGDRGLLFKAASTSQLEIQGTRYMLCPATYAIGADTHGNNWIGVWNNTKTAILNDLTIWNGLVWKCILAVTEPLDAPDLNAVNWVLIPKATFTNFEYIEMIFTVSYDAPNDWICSQQDLNGNICGMSYDAEHNIDYGAGNDFNLCDYTDWNLQTAGYGFFNNKCAGIYNNCVNGITDNTVNQTISGNTCTEIRNNNCIQIMDNTNIGFISNNKCKSIIANSQNGNIEHNCNNGDITNNTSTESCNIHHNINNGSITGVWSTHVLDTIVTKEGV